jgi:asparagine synthase (glutamine-hydrolysing)
MCGIVGFIDFEKKLSTKTLDNLIISLLHRGPDDNGKYFQNFDNYNLGIGHTRLSIQDPTPNGKQPMLHKNIIISYNGEVYNFKIIKKELIDNGYSFSTNTDTEVILKSYDFWGIKFIDKLNGIFAISIFDKDKKKIYLIRDRLGVKPIYWYFDGLTMIYGSELKIFKKINSINKKISSAGLNSYFKYGYVPEPYSILENIYKLQAGSIAELNIENKNLEIKKYWDINHIPTEIEKNDEENVLNKLDNLIADSVELRMISDFPVGIYLSGGVDSSLIASYMTKLSNKPINSFTIGFEDKILDESNYAKNISKFLKTNHHEYILRDEDIYNILFDYENLYDEPFGDASILPMALLAKETKKTSKVVLSADGGDELFFGYDKYRKILNRKKKSNLIPRFLKDLFKKTNFDKTSDNRFLNYLLNQEFIDWLKTESELNNKNKVSKLIKNNSDFKTNFDLKFKFRDSFNEMLCLDIKTFLLDDILWKVDRSTMYSGLEARDPLLDYRLVEYSLNIPGNLKFKGSSLKYLLKELAYKKFPKSLIERPKKGFDVSIITITLKLLNNKNNSLLNKEIILSQNLFNYEEIIRLKNEIVNKNYRNIGLMWLFLIFQIWYLRFMDIKI